MKLETGYWVLAISCGMEGAGYRIHDARYRMQVENPPEVDRSVQFADGIGDMRFKFQISNFKFQAPPGFTLLEVMIAVAIIAIALMAVLGSQSQGLSLAGESRFNRTASLLAQEKMAEIEAAKDKRDLNSDSGDFGDEFPGYTWELSVQDVSFEGVERFSDHLKQIDLEVSWGSDELYQYRLRLYRFFP